MKLPIGLAIDVVKIIPKVKSWFFADGKFNPVRSLIILVAFVLIMFGYAYLGVDETNQAIEGVDEISDIIGYEG